MSDGKQPEVVEEEEASTTLVQQSAPGAETTYNGKRVLYFGGTGYFGLHQHPEIIKSAQQALEQYGTHSGTSRYPYGTTPLYMEVEQRAAEFFGTEDAAYVASGYLHNLAAFQAMAQLNLFGAIFVDEMSHYSVCDFVAAVHKPVFPFRHADPSDLEKQLRLHLSSDAKPLIVSDGIFPTFGELAPVPEYLRLAETFNGFVWLDDAHGVGILGNNGRGTCEHFKLSSARLYFAGTFSKAFGAHGGIIPGSKELIETIRAGHVMNGASPSPSSMAAAAIKGMELVTAHPEWRDRLSQNARQLKQGLRNLGLEMNDNSVPVAAWKLNSGTEMDRVHAELLRRGIMIQRIQYVGSGPEGVLRAVVFSTHTPAHITRLLDELKRII